MYSLSSGSIGGSSFISYIFGIYFLLSLYIFLYSFYIICLLTYFIRHFCLAIVLANLQVPHFSFFFSILFFRFFLFGQAPYVFSRTFAFFIARSRLLFITQKEFLKSLCKPNPKIIDPKDWVIPVVTAPRGFRKTTTAKEVADASNGTIKHITQDDLKAKNKSYMWGQGNQLAAIVF